MTANNRFKQAVRDRMARTGEKYTDARAALLAQRSGNRSTSTMEPPTWEELVFLEPQLLEVEQLLNEVTDDPTETYFCANSAWYRGGFKSELVRLVGWSRGCPTPNVNAGRPRKLRAVNVAQFMAQNDDTLKDLRQKREEAAGFGVLWTSAAYNVAYEHLFSLLPDCRNCQCF